MKKKFIMYIVLAIAAISITTLIYKQKNNSKVVTKPSPTSYGNTGSLKNNSSSNSHGSTSNNSKPKSSLPPKSSDPEGKDKTPKNQKIAYLTFDDGPSNFTSNILDILKSKNVKATFFVIGKKDSQSNEMLRRMVREGHTIGIHSWSHEYRVIYSSESGFLNDFNKLRTYIYKVTGVESNICRFPGGLNNTVSLKYGGHIMPKLYKDVTAMGIKPFDWNVAAHDACKTPPSKELILQNILSESAKHPNAVILMHDTNFTKTSLQALPGIIDNLSARGYTFKTLSKSSPSVLFSPA